MTSSCRKYFLGHQWYFVNSLAPGRRGSVISEHIGSGEDLVNIGWDNGLLPGGTKPLPQLMLTCHKLGHKGHISMKFWANYGHFHSRIYHGKWRQKYWLSYPGLDVILRHWGRDEMDNIRRRQFQTYCLQGKCFNFDKIHWSFVPKRPINNIPALVQIMAWRRQGDKPLSEPMMVRLKIKARSWPYVTDWNTQITVLSFVFSRCHIMLVNLVSIVERAACFMTAPTFSHDLQQWYIITSNMSSEQTYDACA